MNKYYYDLHVHSCLSPCGDDDSTPNNIAGMATLCGLNVVALTDHNTTRNCPGFFEAAKRHGIVPIAGMELTTMEDIHVIFLFENLETALEFDKDLQSKRILIDNRVDVYGEQMIMNGNDEVIGTEKHLLSNATTVSVDDCPKLAEKYNAVCYPAHIDRQANGIIATLGTFPDIKGFKVFELNDGSKEEELRKNYPLGDRKCVVSSDAHYLWNMRDENKYFLIDDEPYSSDLVRRKIFELLR
ncbi:MAG: PHP domain-containing protein [Clostridia bacterium]|nr:PHP domain-containing protein [Clostridia bacterium]